MKTQRKKSGKKEADLLRWSLHKAEMEFGVPWTSLDRRRRQLEISPGADGFYSSRDIAAMMFGDKEAEVIGKIKAEREKTEVEGQRLRQERIPIEIVEQVNGEAFSAIGAIIKSHRGKILDDGAIEDLQTALREVPKKLGWKK